MISFTYGGNLSRLTFELNFRLVIADRLDNNDRNGRSKTNAPHTNVCRTRPESKAASTSLPAKISSIH